jgi:PKHD-type hydroxylase
MTSKYFKCDADFDFVMDNDPTKISSGDYWHLSEKNYETYCWNSDIFSDKELDAIKILGQRLNPSRATTGNPQDLLNHRRSFVSWIHANYSTSWLYQRMTDLVNENNKKYFQFDLDMIEKLQFTFYDSSENGCYKQHVDPLQWTNPHNRKLSFIIQLSDPNQYEGGEIKLYTGQEITIKKQKGLIVFFPSNILHEVTPVTRGERYTLVGWVHGPSFK